MASASGVSVPLPANVVVDLPPIQTSVGIDFVWFANRLGDYTAVETVPAFTVGSLSLSGSETAFPYPDIACFPDMPGSSGSGSGSSGFNAPYANKDRSVVWVTAPAVYTIQATIAWTTAPVDASEASINLAANSVPHVLQTTLTTSLGLATNGSNSFDDTMNTTTSSAASMNTLTPFVQPPPSGRKRSVYYDNFITQDLTSTVLVPAGRFLAFRFMTLASREFPTAPTPVLYSLRVTGDFASRVPTLTRSLGNMRGNGMLQVQDHGRTYHANDGGAGTVVTVHSASYIAPVVLFSVFVAATLACAIAALVR
jgi:hypothetical protein